MWNAILFICYSFVSKPLLTHMSTKAIHIFLLFFYVSSRKWEKNRAKSVLHLPVQHKKAINMLQLQKLWRFVDHKSMPWTAEIIRSISLYRWTVVLFHSIFVHSFHKISCTRKNVVCHCFSRQYTLQRFINFL